jgi:choice-of-anchor C domain-containing protein
MTKAVRTRFGLAVLFLTALVLAVGGVHAANLVSNGGFETGDTSDWTAGDVDVVSSSTWAPSEGSFSLDLNGFFPGFISQDIATVPGTTYTVLFDLAGNPAAPQNVKRLEVSAAGDSANFEFDTTGKSSATVATMGWREESFTFTATDTTTTLEFRSLHAPATHPDRAQGAALDNIRVDVPVIEVDIDIKPNSDPSSFGCKSRGSIPVAILSDADFDATEVDADTVRFGKNGDEAGEVHQKNGHAKRHVEDVNKDGLDDLVLHFDFTKTGFSCDDIPDGEKSVTLTGKLTGNLTADAGGTAIKGESDIRLVGKN